MVSDFEQDRIENLVRRYRTLAGVIAEMQAEQAQIVSYINEQVDVGWSIEVDGVPASKRKGRRQFDLTTAVTFLTADQRDESKRVMFDVTMVRELIEAEGLLDECMIDVANKPIVVLR